MVPTNALVDEAHVDGCRDELVVKQRHGRVRYSLSSVLPVHLSRRLAGPVGGETGFPKGLAGEVRRDRPTLVDAVHVEEHDGEARAL